MTAPGFLGDLSCYPNGIYGSASQIDAYARQSMMNLLNDDDLDEYLNLELDQLPSNIADTSDIHVPPATSSETSHSRFAAPLSDSTIRDLNQSIIPKKTTQRDNWAHNALKDWQVQRTALPDELYKETFQKELQVWTDSELNYWIPKFIYEVRKKNGSRYPANSLVSLVSGLQHKINQLDSQRCVKFFRKECFKSVTEALDANMKLSSQSGIGIHTKSAEVLSNDEEELLWNSSQLGSDNPTCLLNTLFFLNGLYFAIRGGDEHRALQITQFEIVSKPGELSKVVYKEGTTKTYSGGILHRAVKPKTIEHHENIENPERCHVRLLKKYLDMRTSNAVSAFYLKPYTQ